VECDELGLKGPRGSLFAVPNRDYYEAGEHRRVKIQTNGYRTYFWVRQVPAMRGGDL
jgi:hypothetical protein